MELLADITCTLRQETLPDTFSELSPPQSIELTGSLLDPTQQTKGNKASLLLPTLKSSKVPDAISSYSSQRPLGAKTKEEESTALTIPPDVREQSIHAKADEPDDLDAGTDTGSDAGYGAGSDLSDMEDLDDVVSVASSNQTKAD